MSRKQYLPLFTFRFAFFRFVSILPFIFLLSFCSSANHSNASSEVGEQKIASTAFCFSLFAFSGLFQHLLGCSAHQHDLLVCSLLHRWVRMMNVRRGEQLCRIAMGLKDTPRCSIILEL